MCECRLENEFRNSKLKTLKTCTKRATARSEIWLQTANGPFNTSLARQYLELNAELRQLGLRGRHCSQLDCMAEMSTTWQASSYGAEDLNAVDQRVLKPGQDTVICGLSSDITWKNPTET